MTTGRINQVATVGLRQGARQTINGARTERSSRRTRTTTQRSFSIVRSPRRPVGPPVGRSRRGPGRGRPLLSPSRHPLRGRNTQDGQARIEPRRVAHRSDLDRKTTRWKSTEETLAGPQARWPRSQPGVFKIASYQSDSVRPSKANRVRDRSTTYQHQTTGRHTRRR